VELALDSSGSFERRERSANWLNVSELADFVPSRGHRGGVIPMHRALAKFRLGPMNLVTAISLLYALHLSG
jgi:hypothetical protein